MAAARSRASWLALLALAFLAGCWSEAPREAAAPEAPSLKRQAGETLAHEHTIEVEVGEAAVPAVYEQAVDACIEAADFSCTVLSADLATGERASASLRLRVEPAGVDAIREIVAGLGTITRQSTQVQDLAEAIADTKARTRMLESERDRLLEIQARAGDNVEALIRIAAELARVQSELERLAGEAAHQRLRVETDILEIRFAAARAVAFWRPIGDALATFSAELSAGIAEAIAGFARVLPWFVVLLPFFLALRWAWRWTRGR